MATYVTKKCPHCGYTYQFHQSGEQRRYGCPYKTCEKCAGHYWDRDVVEPALHGYENAYETRKKIGTILVIALFFLPLTLGGLVVAVLGLIVGETQTWAFLPISALCGFYLAMHIRGCIIEKRNRDKILEERRTEYDASMQRLQNTDYLIALAKIDKKAKKLLDARSNGAIERYGKRPE